VGLLGLIPVRVGRVRAPAIAAALGGAVAVVALYVMWVVWTHGVLRQLGVVAPVWRLAVHPVPLSHIVRRIGAVGTWKYQGTVYRGPVLYALWMVEAGLVLAAGTLLPPKGLYSDRPVCTGCGTRCARGPNLPRFDGRRQADVLAAIDGRGFDVLSSCPAAPHDDAPEMSLTLMSCPGCRQMHVLTVNRIAWERRRNGSRFVRTVPLINQQLITPDEAERLTVTCARIRAERSRPEQTSAVDPGSDEIPAGLPTNEASPGLNRQPRCASAVPAPAAGSAPPPGPASGPTAPPPAARAGSARPAG
jgi:hypothetical protein